jgi:hypothetical protein
MRFIEVDHRRSASRRSVRRDADPDQDLVVLGHGPLDLLDPEGLRRPVAIDGRRERHDWILDALRVVAAHTVKK